VRLFGLSFLTTLQTNVLFAMETKTAMHHTKETKQLCVFLFGDKKVIFCFKVKYKGSMDFVGQTKLRHAGEKAEKVKCFVKKKVRVWLLPGGEFLRICLGLGEFNLF
jgi:hypothetical protein